MSMSKTFLEDLGVNKYFFRPSTSVGHSTLFGVLKLRRCKTLDSIRKDDFGLVHEDIQITFICELALIITDFWFVWGLDHTDFLFIRLPFIVLTFINLFIITFIMIKYRLFSFLYKGAKTVGTLPDDDEKSIQSNQI